MTSSNRYELDNTVDPPSYEGPGPGPSRTASTDPGVFLQALVQDDSIESFPWRIERAVALQQQALGNGAPPDALLDIVQDVFMSHLLRLVTTRDDISRLFVFFQQHIRLAIIPDVLRTKPSPARFTFRVAQTCYDQAREGVLQPEYCFAKQEFQDTTESRQEWTKFWLQLLVRSPGGPTLFRCLPEYRKRKPAWYDVPPLLFRALAPGRTDVESKFIKDGQHSTSFKVSDDIFSINLTEAREMLGVHYGEAEDRVETPDNLVSWTSSLHAAIQTAKWQADKNSDDSWQVVAVEARKFPPGQFIRDKLLIRMVCKAQGRDREPDDLKAVLLDPRRPDHGDYFSQGVVDMQGKGVRVAIKDLEESGLWSLYPGFRECCEDPDVKLISRQAEWSKWTTTTPMQMHLALRIAERCFKELDAMEIAILLLTLKNRAVVSKFRRAFVMQIQRLSFCRQDTC